MAQVKDILDVKGGSVHSVSENTTVLDATRRMNDARIGALVVTDDNEGVAGIFTERDVLRRVVAEGRDPAGTVLAVVMTTQVACCQPDTPLDDVRALMTQKRIRHVPVVHETGKLAGLISIGDVNAHYANGAEVQIQYLHEYIYGRA